jgi:hypothetical protein
MSGPLLLEFGQGGYANLPIPSSFEFGIIHNTQVFTSPLNGQTQTLELPGARWRVRMGYEELTEADIREFMAFMVELRGMANRFTMYDLSHPSPLLAVSGGSVAIAGGPTDPNRITVDGMKGADFSPGDMISINRGGAGDVELKMIIRVVSPVSAEVATYDIEPGLRIRPLSTYNDDPIIYVNAPGHFMLSSDTQTNWVSQGKVPLSSIELEGIEVFAGG